MQVEKCEATVLIFTGFGPEVNKVMLTISCDECKILRTFSARRSDAHSSCEAVKSAAEAYRREKCLKPDSVHPSLSETVVKV